MEMCQTMKIGQIFVFCDLSDARLTVPARRPSPSFKEYLKLVSVLNDAVGITKHILKYIWVPMSSDLNDT